MRRWWLSLCCAAFLVPLAARSATGEVSVERGERYELSKLFTFLEDPSGRMTLDDVLRPQSQAAFRAVPDKGPAANFGLTRSAIWLRIQIHAARDTPRDWLLEVAYPPLNQLEVYSQLAGGGFEEQVAGNLQPFASRAIPHRNHVLPLALAPGADTTIFLRIH